jgi:UDP-N-acetylmuramoyl-tripeptide--D-alanyl-D-alanine ligase
LGDTSLEEHHEIGRAAAEAGLAGLVTVGELGRHLAEGARETGLADVAEATDNAEATALIVSRLAAGDVVLVKGSRAMQMEEIVAALLGTERGGHG